MGHNVKRGEAVWVLHDNKSCRRVQGTVLSASKYSVLVEFTPGFADTTVRGQFKIHKRQRSYGGPAKFIAGSAECEGSWDWYRVYKLNKFPEQE